MAKKVYVVTSGAATIGGSSHLKGGLVDGEIKDVDYERFLLLKAIREATAAEAKAFEAGETRVDLVEEEEEPAAASLVEKIAQKDTEIERMHKMIEDLQRKNVELANRTAAETKKGKGKGETEDRTSEDQLASKDEILMRAQAQYQQLKGASPAAAASAEDKKSSSEPSAPAPAKK